MKREYQEIGNIYHIFNQGSRGLPYLYGDSDWWMVIRLLYYLNDEYQNENWEKQLSDCSVKIFERPMHWPERDPLVEIIDFCLHDNHYHLLVRQIKEGGISKFMRRFPNSISRRHNLIHGGTGSIFQGPYQVRRIVSNPDFYNIVMYIRVKNVFERYPKGGIEGARKDFENAYKWALSDSFSSFPDYVGDRNSPIIEKDMTIDLFVDKKKFKKKVKEYLNNYEKIEENVKDLII